MSNGWNDLPIPFGREGLDLKRAIDSVSPSKLTRMQNLRQIEDGSLTPRPGQTVLATGPFGSTVHSICSAALPSKSQHTRVWGIGTGVYRGTSGALGAAEDTGYSGDPLSLVPYRTKSRGDPWVFIADRSRMRKMNIDTGVVMPIGLAAPPAACTAERGVELMKPVEEFDSGFTGFAKAGGSITFDYPGPPDSKSTNALRLAPMASGTKEFWAGAAKAFPLPIDATTFGSSVDITDDDFVHLWLRVNYPAILLEVRVYLVCSAYTAVTALNVPGMHETQNTDAFVKSFRPNDLTLFVEQRATSLTSTQIIIRNDQIGDQLQSLPSDRTAESSGQTEVGRGQWTEFGVVGKPLRRGDFLRIGSDETRGWATLTGVVVVVQTESDALIVSVDDMYIRGGRGLDSTEPGSEPYDYRTTNYDPRTGAESNPSLEMLVANKLDSIRRSIVVDPAAYGDANIRQRFYRRGGTSNENWSFVGVNASDGGLFTDTASDVNAEGGGVLEIDHDLPITTVDDAGVTVKGQAVPALWGPVQEMLFACGDPYQPGSVYFCVPQAPDYWPSTNRVSVCGDSEELMNGCVWAGQSWVFSREALYQLVPRLSGESNVTALPTGCKKGLVSRWALCSALGGIFFVTVDGICVTTGDSPTDLTDADVRGLFHGETRNGYLPVDLTETTKMRLVVHQSELRFLYQDTGGTARELVLNLLTKQWRWNTYARGCVGMYSETSMRGSTLIFGGNGTGAAYSNEGTSDDSFDIACRARTGALDAGQPRAEKLFGDLTLDLDRDGETVTVQCYLDNESQALATETISTGSGRDRNHLHPFGTVPSQARNVSVDVSWTTGSNTPKLYFGVLSATLLPDTTVKRVTQWENLGSPAEKFLTGITLDVDTSNVAKTVRVEYTLDNGAIQVADTLTVLANGRKQMRFSWPMVKADLFRLRPTDSNEWNLFGADWEVSPEPRRTSKWNGNYVIEGTLADKWVKGIIFECDTLNLPKTIEIYGDGVLQGTETVTANGRQVVQLDWPQFRARVLHYRATDDNPGLRYQAEWVFDEEPWSLTRWETQEITHGITGYHMLLFGSIAYRVSGAHVHLEITAYAQDGTATVKSYTLPTTSGAKRIPYVPFEAVKGIAFKYLFTSSVKFWLYREESCVMVQPCVGGATLIRHPFGNDNRDHVRNMALAHGGV